VVPGQSSSDRICILPSGTMPSQAFVMFVVCLDEVCGLVSFEPPGWLPVGNVAGHVAGAWKPGKVWSCDRVSSTAKRCSGRYLMRHPFDLIIELTVWNRGVAVWVIDR